MKEGVADYSVDDFYYLSRAAGEGRAHLDRSTACSARSSRAWSRRRGRRPREIPEEWLRKLAEKLLTEEEKAQIEALGGWEKLMETLKKRLEEQKGRHQGGSKWIGTAGTSPFGAYGYNPEGVRIGQDEGRNRRAVKVWDKREFKDLDDDEVELGTRNIKVALRRLRRFARRARPTSSTSTAPSARPRATPATLDIKMVPERHNAVKVLLLLDIGGSMDDHIRVCEELFSAARPSSSTSSTSTSTTASTSACGRTTAAATPRAPGDRARPGGAAHLRPDYKADLRRRRLHEPLRDRLSRRQRRALERGGRLTNLLSPGDDPGDRDRALLRVLGEDGVRPRHRGADAPADWRRGAGLARCARARRRCAHAIKAVCAVHNETATGMTLPLPSIRAALDAAGIRRCSWWTPSPRSARSISAWTNGASMRGRRQPEGADAAVGMSFTGVSEKAMAAHALEAAEALLQLDQHAAAPAQELRRHRADHRCSTACRNRCA
jgi:hypothetical protein